MSPGKRQEGRHDEYAPKDILLPPLSNSRQRLDGGVDETTRVNFEGALTPLEMREIARLLLETVMESGDTGLVALTRMEFLEPDTCEFRYWTERRDKAQMWQLTLARLELIRRLERIHKIRDVDGNFRDTLGLEDSPESG
jgi:hypothetical protein